MKRIVCCALVIVAWGSALAHAGECCDRCGCQCACRKVCRLVCETKKVPKVTYSCQCEDFCVPGPSDHCVMWDECGNKHHAYTPTCAQVRTRKKLVKHETFEEVPSHKLVVESMCDACAGKCGSDALPAAGGTTQRENGPTSPATFDGTAREEASPSSATQASHNENAGFAAQLRRLLQPALGQK